jgi:hypothetical protein
VVKSEYECKYKYHEVGVIFVPAGGGFVMRHYHSADEKERLLRLDERQKFGTGMPHD